LHSPFYDKKGNQMDISKMKYCHLKQLDDYNEGHYLAFREKLVEVVRINLQ